MVNGIVMSSRPTSIKNILYIVKKPCLVPRSKLSLHQSLSKKGFLQALKRGRPSLYATDEERRIAHQAQQKECSKRHSERVKEARRRMREGTHD